MYSPISSVLMRFSMLSLTFCSWPERVWMTNHWFRIGVLGDKADQPRDYEIDADNKTAQQNNGDHDDHRRALQLVHRGPGALAQFFACLDDVVGYAQEIALPPEHPKEHSDDNHPQQQFY